MRNYLVAIPLSQSLKPEKIDGKIVILVRELFGEIVLVILVSLPAHSAVA
jgi:hypothetical protein